MAEPFKNMLNSMLIRSMATHFHKHYSQFDAKGFSKAASKNLTSLELKERSEQITQAMIQFLPSSFNEAGKIIQASLGPPLDADITSGTTNKHGITGWAIMPMSHFVGLQGLEHFDLSMILFKAMTQRWTSEFGIRFFLIHDSKKTLAELKTWVNDDSQHVRRLVSEGIRPRLPWAMNLPEFIKNPTPVIKILEKLKDDNEEYVRRSVANNLNDIAKDHPNLVASIAEKWLQGAPETRKKLIKHACRTLIKNGHKKALKALGYKPPKIKNAIIKILTPKVMFGDALKFTFSIQSSSKKNQPVIIDYIIHHQKANGKTSPKVFKWKSLLLQFNKTLTATKKHNIKKITTRVYYPGMHKIAIVVNGLVVGEANFELLMP